MSKLTTEALDTIETLSRRVEIILSLQPLTSRDLRRFPPQDGDTMGADLGIGETSLDHLVRPWINKRFRVPDNKPQLAPGTISGATTFKELCEFAGAEQ